MEVKIDKNNVLRIVYKLKKSETYKISKSNQFQTISIFKRPILIKGFSNCTQFNKYIPTGDYDEVSKEIVLEDAYRLISEYNLPPFYLFTTKENNVLGEKIGNYHLINLRTFSYSKVKEIIGEIRGDEKYKTMNERHPFKSWVLRLSKKGIRNRPKFLGIVGENKNLNYEISEAHLILLEKLYKLPKINYLKKDGGESVRIHTYES